MTLVEFLLARIAEDEKLAREALEENPEPTAWVAERRYDGTWAMDLHSTHPDADSHGVGEDVLVPREMAKHIVGWKPARVLAECEAKRRIVERYENTTFDHWAEPDREYEHWILPLLAVPYADHPDYQQEWRP